jgi:peptide/nickel transport system substrate-binding protein
LTWTFAIDPAARWDDGTPLGAGDAVYTIGIASELGIDGKYWESITPTIADDGVSLVVSSPRALADLPAMLGELPLLPAHLYTGLAAADIPAAAAAQPPHGSGPFQLDALSQSTAALHRRVDLLAADAPGPTDVAGAVATEFGLRFFADADSAAGAWSSGSGLDLLVGLDHAAALAAAARRGEVVSMSSTVFTGIAPNLRPGAVLRAPEIRQALVALLDPGSIVGTYGGVVATTPVAPRSWAAAKTPDPVRGAAAAAALLKRAKWTYSAGGWMLPSKKPARLEILTLPAQAFPADAAVAAQAAAAWGTFGIPTTVSELDADALAARLAAGEFTLAVVSIDIGLEPDLYTLFGSGAILTGGNITGIQLRALDSMLNAARRPGTLVERQAAAAVVQRWLASALYVLPVRFSADEVLVGDRVRGVDPMVVGDPESHLRAVLSFRLAAP